MTIVYYPYKVISRCIEEIKYIILEWHKSNTIFNNIVEYMKYRESITFLVRDHNHL